MVKWVTGKSGTLDQYLRPGQVLIISSAVPSSWSPVSDCYLCLHIPITCSEQHYCTSRHLSVCGCCNRVNQQEWACKLADLTFQAPAPLSWPHTWPLNGTREPSVQRSGMRSRKRSLEGGSSCARVIIMQSYARNWESRRRRIGADTQDPIASRGQRYSASSVNLCRYCDCFCLNRVATGVRQAKWYMYNYCSLFFPATHTSFSWLLLLLDVTVVCTPEMLRYQYVIY